MEFTDIDDIDVHINECVATTIVHWIGYVVIIIIIRVETAMEGIDFVVLDDLSKYNSMDSS